MSVGRRQAAKLPLHFSAFLMQALGPLDSSDFSLNTTLKHLQLCRIESIRRLQERSNVFSSCLICCGHTQSSCCVDLEADFNCGYPGRGRREPSKFNLPNKAI